MLRLRSMWTPVIITCLATSGCAGSGDADKSTTDTDTSSTDGADTDGADTDGADTDGADTDVDPTRLSAPVLLLAAGQSPSTNAMPTISGTAPAGSDVSLFATDDCTGTPLTTVNGAGTTFEATITVAENTATPLSANAARAGSTTSACSAPITYVHDTLSPAAAVLSSTTPASPANANTVLLFGVAEAGHVAKVYGSDNCGDPLLITGTSGALTTGLSVDVDDDTVTPMSVRLVDTAGNESVCSNAVTYTEDSLAPAAPVLTGFDVSTPGADPTPGVLGSGEAGSDVILFTDAACTGAELARTSAAVLNSGGALDVLVSLNAETSLYALAEDAAGNRSACVDPGLTYVHDDVAPTANLSGVVSWVPTTATLTFSALSDNMFPVDALQVDVCVGQQSTGCAPFVTTHVVTPVGGVVELTEVAPDTTLHVWARAVDPAGNRSSVSGPASARTPSTGGVVDAAVGAHHTCVATAGGDVRCAGDNASGQLGIAGGTQTTLGRRVSNLSAVDVAVGEAHSCARTALGEVYCWGDNRYGQAGVGAATIAAPNLISFGVETALALSLGNNHSCALLSDGSVMCWGRGESGQIGNGLLDNTDTPKKVIGSVGFRTLDAGANHTCAINGLGEVWCWGDDANGQLGDGAPVVSGLPVHADTTLDAISLGLGDRHSCAVLGSGILRCWGANDHKQLGTGLSASEVHAPAIVQSVSGAERVDGGASHTCAVKTNGVTYCWGENSMGQLGRGTSGADGSLRALVDGNPTLNQLSVGGHSTCAWAEDAQLTCWGSNQGGVIASGSMVMATSPVPVDVISQSKASSVFAGHDVSGMMSTRGGVWMWGENTLGQQGSIDAESQSPPGERLSLVALGALHDISIGAVHGCGLDVTGQVYCWGVNDAGQVEPGGASGVGIAPQVLAELPPMRDIDARGKTTCGATEHGTVMCWGDNSDFQYGTFEPYPFETPGLSDIVQVAVGHAHACALRSDGEAICWGTASHGQLGFAETNGVQHTPSTVPNTAQGIAIVAGAHHTCMLRADGAIQCWGAAALGQLGRPSLTTEVSNAGFVESDDTFVDLFSGDDHTCAVRADRELVCWGQGDLGALGPRGTAGANAPLSTGVRDVLDGAAGARHTCVLTPSNIGCFGYNGDKQLGQDAVTGPTYLEVDGLLP